jgi:cyanophycinase
MNFAPGEKSMSPRRLVAAALVLLIGFGLAPLASARTPASGLGYAYYEIGDIKAATPGPTQAGMMLHGGGDWDYDAFRWMFRKAGGGHMVVLKASYANENGEEMFNKIGGVTSVQTIIFSSRRAAFDPKVLAIVRHADGIFLGGGDQAKYIRFWKGTPLNAALDAHVRGGKPIGGTSAGLAVLGAYSYGALDGGSIDAPTALKDPLGPQVTLVRDFLHLPYLSNVITDSHFKQRQRLGRLIVFVARLAHEQRNAGVTGIGVDENTALCIDDKGVGQVFSGNGGHAWLVRPLRQADVIALGKPLTFAAIPLVGIGPDSAIDLNTFVVTKPGFQRTADVKAGVLTVTPN